MLLQAPATCDAARRHNVWIAAHDEHDPDYERCASVLRHHANALAAPVTVVTETAWFLEATDLPSKQASSA